VRGGEARVIYIHIHALTYTDMYIYVCTRVYTCIYIHMNVNAPKDPRTWRRTRKSYVYIYMHLHTQICKYIYVHVYIHAYIYIRMSLHPRIDRGHGAGQESAIYIRIYAHTRTEICTHICTRIYTFIHIHTNVTAPTDRPRRRVGQGSAGLGRFLEKGACFAGAKVAKQDFAEDRCTQRHRLYVCMCVCVLLHARVIPVCA